MFVSVSRLRPSNPPPYVISTLPSISVAHTVSLPISHKAIFAAVQHSLHSSKVATSDLFIYLIMPRGCWNYLRHKTPGNVAQTFWLAAYREPAHWTPVGLNNRCLCACVNSMTLLHVAVKYSCFIRVLNLVFHIKIS